MIRNIACRVNGESHREWLSPTAALTRFVPPRQSYKISEEQSGRQVRYGFRVHTVGLLIPLGTPSEVIEPVSVYPLPNTPPWLIGLINLRGNLTPVFDLHEILNLKPQENGKRPLLILDKDELAVGFPIDSLPVALDLNQPPINQPPIPEVLRAHVSSVHLNNDVIWLDFDHRVLLRSLAERVVT